MNYKEALYRRYHATHNRHLYGEPGLARMRKEFAALDAYYKKRLPAARDANILELGCGDGSFVYYLQSRGYRRACGVDISPEQIEVARDLGIENVWCGDARTWLTKKSVYDAIVARDLLEHLTKQEAFDLLMDVAESLVPGGCFIMQVPNGEGLYAPSIIYGDYTHESPFTASSGRQLLLNAGFSSVTAYAIEPLPAGRFGWLRAPLWKLRVAYHRLWKIIETGNGSGLFTSTIVIMGIK